MKEEKATHLKAYRLNKNRFLLVSHPHYPSHFLYCNRLCALICFHIRTIPLAFRRGGARSSRCTKYCHSPQPSQKDNNPSLSTMSLPPLSKGGGLTARHKLLLCCVLLATRPPFYSLNFSAVKTEGLLYHPLPRTIPPTFRRVSVCVCLVGFASMPRQPFVPLHRATALCGCHYASLHSGFVRRLTASILAWSGAVAPVI